MEKYIRDWNNLLAFTSFCVTCAVERYLNLTDQQLIRLYGECWFMADVIDWHNLLLLTRFCMACAVEECLNLTDQQLIRLYGECLVIAEHNGDCSTQSTVSFILGAVCQKIEKFTEAIAYLERGLVIAIQSNNIYIQACAYAQLGYIHNSLENSKQGLLYAEKCLAMAIKMGHRSLERNAYECLGTIYHSKGEYQKAIKYYEKELAITQEINDKIGEGYAYYHLGNVYWSLDMRGKTKECYKKCLLVIPLMNDVQVEDTVYGCLGAIYYLSGKYDKAITYYEKQLKLVKDDNDSKREAAVYGNLGNIYETLDKYDEAIEYYTKQLALAEATDCKEEIKNAHFNVGDAYYSVGKHVDAIKHFKEFLTISTKMEDKKMKAFAYRRLGACSRLLSDFYKSIEYYNESLNIALETNNKVAEVDACMEMGCTYLSLGKYEETIDYEEKALTIAEEMNDEYKRGLIYGQLGIAFHSLGKYSKALEYCFESLKIIEETGNKKDELQSQRNLGLIYFYLGKYHESLQCYEKALDLQRETGYVGDLLAVTYHDIGNVHFCLDDDENASKNFKTCLSICQQRGQRKLEGEAYGSLRGIYQKLGKYQEATECSKKALTIFREIGDKIAEVDSLAFLRSITKSCFQCEDYASAFDYSKKWLALAVSSGDKESELNTCLVLGFLHYQTSGSDEEHMKQCKKHLQQSLQCCEWIFDHLHDKDDCKITKMDTLIHAYEFLTLVLIKTGEFNEALVVSDRGRARGLCDLLELKYNEVPKYGNLILTYAEVDAILHTGKSREFCVLYFAVFDDFVATWVLAHQKPSVFLKVNAKGFAHTQLPTSQHNVSANDIISEVIFAAYDDMDVRNVLSCEDRSLNYLPESQVQVLQNEDHFVRVKGQKEGQSIPPDQNKRHLQEVAPNPEEKNAECPSKNPLEMLYTELIAPVIQNLPCEDVVIVPHGPLYGVPFAALRDPETGLFLSEMKRIRMVPSLTTLKHLQECPADYHTKTGALVVGDPDSGTVMFQGEEKPFPPLPKARLEATVISNILGVTPLIGKQATKDVIKQRFNEGVKIIHIAAHGSMKGEIVLAPCALTGGRKIPEEEDYMLTMQEVQETGIKAQLVVLSCCHSGRGEIRAEGIVGISRGFLAAGARAVVASLWGIDDEATLIFMVNFYTCLKIGKSASESLQQAMKEVRDDPDFEGTRDWAPFFLIGDDVTISLK